MSLGDQDLSNTSKSMSIDESEDVIYGDDVFVNSFAVEVLLTILLASHLTISETINSLRKTV